MNTFTFPIEIYDRRNNTFHPIIRSDSPIQETDDMHVFIAEFISKIQIPYNMTSSPIKYVFEVFLKGIPTGVMRVITVDALSAL